MNPHTRYINRAIELATQNVARSGGPFGAVIVREEKIIAEGANRVTPGNDPTAHAEIVAIREACRVLANYSLAGCTIYASCEPCPMCLGAIYWARLDALYYAAGHEDAARAGFDDRHIYKQLALPPENRSLPTTHIPSDKAEEPFEAWRKSPESHRY